jgi:hypothetical protein
MTSVYLAYATFLLVRREKLTEEPQEQRTTLVCAAVSAPGINVGERTEARR